MLNRTIFASLLALVAFAVSAGTAAAAPQALVFSRVTTSGHGSEAVERGGLYVARGGRVDQLTDDPADTEPVFSPDGVTIAFVRDGDLFSMRPDGTGEREITSGVEVDARPQFSVDGRTIVFERSAGAGAARDLYSVGVARRRAPRPRPVVRRRARSRTLSQRQDGRLRPQHGRGRRRHRRRDLLDPVERERSFPAQQRCRRCFRPPLFRGWDRLRSRREQRRADGLLRHLRDGGQRGQAAQAGRRRQLGLPAGHLRRRQDHAVHSLREPL